MKSDARETCTKKLWNEAARKEKKSQAAKKMI
jgi:hypothetical protein